MRAVQLRSIVVALALGLLTGWSSPVAAQSGGLVLTVTDSVSGIPLGAVEVELRSGANRVWMGTTNRLGEARAEVLPSGTYTALLQRAGFRTRTLEGVRVGGTPVERTVPLAPLPQSLDGVVVSASRSEETVFEAPRSVSVVNRDDVQSEPALSTIDRIAALPGASVVTGGLVQRRYTVRGQNVNTAAQLRTLVDSRYAVLPNVDHNIPYVLSVNDEDVDRIELLRGPAAALYGPNTNRGVLHIVTRSPFESEGTALSLTGGQRSFFQAQFRHAQAVSESFAFKISGNYYRGDDWETSDPSEAASRQQAIDAGADPDTLRVGLRDHGLEGFAGELRLDWRLDNDAELVVALGTAVAKTNFDPLTFGGFPVQMNDAWLHSGQVRYERGELHANVFLNQTQVDNSAYLTNNGYVLADRSTAAVAQLRHGTRVGERQRFRYGFEVQRTVPRTRETQHQFTEEIDNLTELGAFLHSETSLSPRWDLMASGRVDHHSALEDAAFSPSVGVVFKPTPPHAFRLSYATGFATPGSGILFNDYPLAELGPYQLRTLGLYRDLTFRRDCGGPCMRSPFSPDPSAYLSPEATQMWPAIVAALQAQGIDLSGLPAPTSADVGTLLAALNPTTFAFDPVTAADVVDVDRWSRLKHRTVELGYKGVLGNQAFLTVDLHYNDMGPVLTERTVPTPNVFFDPVSLEAYLGAFMPAANAAALAAAIAEIPVGTITPEQANVPTALMLVEREGGDVTYWGADVGVTVNLTPELQASGAYSWTSEDLLEDVAESADFLFLNPKHRGSLGLAFENESRFRANLEARFVGGFPAFAGIARADLDGYSVVDASVSFPLPGYEAVEVALTANNLLDDRHRQMPGSPVLGRLLLTRIRVRF